MPVQLTLTCVGAMFALPFVILYLLGKPKPYVLFFLNFLINTVLVLAVVATYDWYLNQHLHSFDLDGDGIFSGTEITPRQSEAMLRVTDDVGRNIGPLVWIAFSSIYYGVFSLVYRLAFYGKRSKTSHI